MTPLDRPYRKGNVESKLKAGGQQTARLLDGVSVVFTLLAFGLAGLERHSLKRLAVLCEQLGQICHCKHGDLRMLHGRGTMTGEHVGLREFSQGHFQ